MLLELFPQFLFLAWEIQATDDDHYSARSDTDNDNVTLESLFQDDDKSMDETAFEDETASIDCQVHESDEDYSLRKREQQASAPLDAIRCFFWLR